MNYKKLFLITLLSLVFMRCTKLDEKLRGEVTFDQASAITNVSALLKASYDGLQLAYVDQANYWALSEHTTDEAIPPTRGGDWDDNGIWRVLHTHTWNSEHTYITNTFNNLLQIVFNASNTLNFNPSPQVAAEAKFLRAFAMYAVVDGWGQVPYRSPGENLLNAPKVLTAAEALDTIITQINQVMANLPDGPAYKANKYAAKVLLMRCYLNKGAFLNRQTPTFAAADMNQVISLANEIISSGKYSLANNFYDNFAPTNNAISTENIFTLEDGPGLYSARPDNKVNDMWHMSLHYNQPPGGWNGFTTLADFYDKFEASDMRKNASYPGVTDSLGLHLGMLYGQQFSANGTPLKDRKGNPLFYTREVSLKETGANLEVTGIRVVKYPPDLTNDNEPNNDYVFYRYADVLLMKAEALARTGDNAGALTIINQIRQKRGASQISSGAFTLNTILDERGREMYWEGTRRDDLIRFGKFLAPFAEKPNTDDPKVLLFPIPSSALAVNPNLKQNPGYQQ